MLSVLLFVYRIQAFLLESKIFLASIRQKTRIVNRRKPQSREHTNVFFQAIFENERDYRTTQYCYSHKTAHYHASIALLKMYYNSRKYVSFLAYEIPFRR